MEVEVHKPGATDLAVPGARHVPPKHPPDRDMQHAVGTQRHGVATGGSVCIRHSELPAGPLKHTDQQGVHGVRVLRPMRMQPQPMQAIYTVPRPHPANCEDRHVPGHTRPSLIHPSGGGGVVATGHGRNNGTTRTAVERLDVGPHQPVRRRRLPAEHTGHSVFVRQHTHIDDTDSTVVGYRGRIHDNRRNRRFLRHDH